MARTQTAISRTFMAFITILFVSVTKVMCAQSDGYDRSPCVEMIYVMVFPAPDDLYCAELLTTLLITSSVPHQIWRLLIWRSASARRIFRRSIQCRSPTE